MNLSSIGLAGRNDANGPPTQSVDHTKHPAFDAAKKLVAVLTIRPAVIRAHYPVRVQKSPNNEAKSKPLSAKQASLLALSHSNSIVEE